MFFLAFLQYVFCFCFCVGNRAWPALQSISKVGSGYSNIFLVTCVCCNFINFHLLSYLLQFVLTGVYPPPPHNRNGDVIACNCCLRILLTLSLSFSVVCTFFPQAIQRFFNDEWFNSKEQFRLPCYKCHSSAGYGGAEFTRDCYPGLYYIPQLDPQDPTWDLGGLFVCGGQCMDWLVPEAKKLG